MDNATNVSESRPPGTPFGTGTGNVSGKGGICPFEGVTMPNAKKISQDDVAFAGFFFPSFARKVMQMRLTNIQRQTFWCE